MDVAQGTFDVPGFIDAQRLGARQYLTILLCGLVMFLDGFDTQSISYMAPMIAKDWHLSRDMLGPIFSSALVGLMVGYLLLAPLSDRFGHRRMMIVSTVAFGILTAINALTTNVTELMALRFLTGLGLGAAIPSAVALTSEYTPKRLRATCVLVIYCGFSLGFVVAGAAAAWLLPLYGWRSLFWVGAAAPLLLAIPLATSLPDSLDFLIRRRVPAERIWAALRNVNTNVPGGSLTFLTDAVDEKTSIASLFRPGRTLGTVLLWAVFFLNLAEFYALQSWLPSILTSLHYSLNTVALATTLTTVGGIVIAVIIGPAMDRLGAYRSLATLYFLGVVFVAMMGLAIKSPEWVLMTATFFAGVCISGGQKSAIALSAIFYPAANRSTGVGWALGIGRLGGIGGPLLLGALLGLKFEADTIFYAAAVPMLIAGILIVIMGAVYGGPSLRSTPALDTPQAIG